MMSQSQLLIANAVWKQFPSQRCSEFRLVLATAVLAGAATGALGQPAIFPADNPWNQSIAAAPVAANSTAIVNALVANSPQGKLHPDFGQDYFNTGSLYGIPYNTVHGNSVPKVTFSIEASPDESDIVPVPLPANVVLEGDFQNGPNPSFSARGDSHLIVWDQDNNVGYELYHAQRPSETTDGLWHADSEAVWNFNADSFRTLGYTSADAAGLPILPGLARPDEGLPTSQGGRGAITHALRFTLNNPLILNQFIYPASHVANPGNLNPATQPPMGTRFRLKSSVPISGLNPQSQVIARAMQTYGLILADNGSNLFFTGASYSVNAGNAFALTWDDNDIQDTVHGLKSLTYTDFEVVDLTPVVSGLSATSAAPGATITVLGQNFSGASGHLAVLFGSTASGLTTVVDDSHATTVVPVGSGVVDVRVQSGLSNDPGDSENITSPIFGYGISAFVAADRFMFIGTCIADFNGDGRVTVQDIFSFLASWFQKLPSADIDHSGTVTVEDIFTFLHAWFAGC